MSSLLRCSGVTVRFGGIVALTNVDLEVIAGEVLAVVGPLGAGKSTLLRVAAGTLAPDRGNVVSDGVVLTSLPPGEVARRGTVLVPAGGGIFPTLTVRENLDLAQHRPQRSADAMRAVSARFPILRERPSQLAGSLSGGEQRQLALARAALQQPRVLLLDEPLLGLAPQVASAVAAMVHDLAANGTAVVLAEERPTAVLQSVATRVVGLQLGRIVDAPATGIGMTPPGPALSARDNQRVELQSVRLPITVSVKRALQTRAAAQGETVGELLARLASDHVGAATPGKES